MLLQDCNTSPIREKTALRQIAIDEPQHPSKFPRILETEDREEFCQVYPWGVVDRAGFEPATFRFFFASMRTRRSLALFNCFVVYQAELPAPGSEGNLRAFKRLLQESLRFIDQKYSIVSAIHIRMKEEICLRSTERSAAQD
jgi:hypothetical protein